MDLEVPLEYLGSVMVIFASEEAATPVLTVTLIFVPSGTFSPSA